MEQGAERVQRPEQEEDEPDGPVERAREWILLTGRREGVATGVLLGVAALVVALLWTGVIGVAERDAVTRAFAALVGGNMTLITIAISINQLVIAREFGTPGELQERIEEMIEYRHETESIAEVDVSPISPSAYLQYLVGTVAERATALGEAVSDADGVDDSVRTTVHEYVETVVEQTEWTQERLHAPATEAFSALRLVLEVDFTGDLHTARWLQTAHEESLPPSAIEALDELSQLFQFLGVLRQYLETLYLQRELALLSRRLFYVGVPAVVCSLLTIWVYGRESGTAVDGAGLQVIVVVAAVVGISPLAVFFSHILRIATVTRRTAALMPFSVRE